MNNQSLVLIFISLMLFAVGVTLSGPDYIFALIGFTFIAALMVIVCLILREQSTPFLLILGSMLLVSIIWVNNASAILN